MKLQVLGCPLTGRAPLIATVLSLWLLHHGFQSRAWSQNLGMGYSGPLPIAVPAGELTSEFQLSEPEQREDLLKRLGVNSSTAHDASVAAIDSPSFSSPASSEARLARG